MNTQDRSIISTFPKALDLLVNGQNKGIAGVNELSLRDWFAGQALAGWTAGGPNIDGAPINMTREHADKIAKGCYRYADAMIAARKETEA